MKKIAFALMVALASTLSFSSCSDDDDEIGESDLTGNTFSYKDKDHDVTYTLKFNDDSEKTYDYIKNGNVIIDDAKKTVASNTVTLYELDGTTIFMTLTGNGAKKLIDQDGITYTKD